MEKINEPQYNELSTVQLQIIRNELLKKECKEKYQEAIFLTLMFINEPWGSYLILESEFFKGRIFKFLNKSNYNYFSGNELFNVYDSLFEFFKTHLLNVSHQNKWSFLEIDNIIKIFSTLILYKPNIKVLNETLVLIQTILDIYLEKQKSLRNDKINISHIGFIFLLLLSEALFLKLSESHQKILSQLNEIFTSDKNGYFQSDDPFFCCIYLFLKQKQNNRDKIIDLISSCFPWKKEINKKLQEEKYFFNKNHIIDQFLFLYDEKNTFQIYKNSLSLNKTLDFNICDVNYQNIIIDEILNKDESYDFSFNNYFFSIFQRQSYPLAPNILKMIEKYAEKLISDEYSKLGNFEFWFPLKEEIIRILEPSFQNIDNKTPEGILIIYFLLHYLDKKNENPNKEKFPWKYDIIFLYSLPLQFHIYLFQIFIEELIKNQENQEEKYNEEFKLNDKLNKLIIIFLPILRSPTFMFTNFHMFYSKNNFISYVNNFTDELDEQFEKKLFNEKLFKKIIALENKTKTYQQIKFLMAFNSTKTSFFIIKLFIEQSQTNLKLTQTSFLDPCYIMLIKKKYFEEPFFLEIILSSLNVLLFNWEFFIKNSDFKNIEGKIYYVLNLKCVIVQFLFEFLDESKTLKKHEEILCKYIHEICIEDYELIRMIIFQGFNTKIIAKAVKYIEWMHACLFFIEELYKRNDIKNPEFSWILLVNLIEKYPMKKSLDICSLFLDYISPLAAYILKDSTMRMMNEILLKIRKIFPQLDEKIFTIQKIIIEKLKKENPFFKFRESKDLLMPNGNLL